MTQFIILAAGAGTRMRSNTPKVLQPLAGKPLLGHLLSTIEQLPIDKSCHLITGHQSERVESFANEQSLSYVINAIYQAEQLGTGHAVQQALPHLPDEGMSVILYADVPLVSGETLTKLIEDAKDSLCLLTQTLDNPKGYGRIIREAGQAVGIVEEKDATDDQRQIKEVNTGMMAVNNAVLKSLLPKLQNNNQQQEYYLTDLIALAHREALPINTLDVANPIEAQGVNDKRQLATLERAYQCQLADALLTQGVTLIDPDRFDLRGTLKISKDVTIDANCIIEGEVELGEGVSIASHCVIGTPHQKTVIGNGVEVKSHSVIECGIIEDNCVIGPYARIRPNTHLHENVKIGNFVEVKKSDIHQGAKVNHLTYIGDATIGSHANIGAGTITCNYDGVNKSKTVIGEGAFIGSNSSLVAPVEVKSGAVVGAGSTITRTVEEDQLAIARGKQRNIDHWPKPSKKS
ncbi:MAG: bifunctional UDP-N-acetylglucosamine diphosphorylase/glucosamine-1-phosphate N-acetyltransferase GlmU [Cellvibrionales bacterium]|nr:bifunctional UDP-N-acetylglucosamine diphosphorylase/glucosamine-1-phosphate N-acetyltransferase GlmU [Cellvibrionales bacterium]